MPNVPWAGVQQWLTAKGVTLQRAMVDRESGHEVIHYDATRELMGQTQTAKFVVVENSRMRADGTVQRTGEYFVSTDQVAASAARLVIDPRDVLTPNWRNEFQPEAAEFDRESAEEETWEEDHDSHDGRVSGHDGNSSESGHGRVSGHDGHSSSSSSSSSTSSDSDSDGDGSDDGEEEGEGR